MNEQDQNSSEDDGKVVSSGDGSLAAGRDAINNKIANISNELRDVQVDGNLTINNTINIPPDIGGQPLSIGRDSLLSAFEQITRSFLADKVAKHPIIRRNIANKIDQYLTSNIRYCFVLGPSGVGKSVLLANEAERLMSSGWTVLLHHGGNFSLESLAETLSYKLSEQIEQLTPLQAIRLLQSEAKNSELGVILFIDAIDEALPDTIALNLDRLHNALSGAPADKLKIVLSCRDIIWERLRYTRLLSLYEPIDSVSGSHGRAFQTIRLGDFTVEELNRALQAIGDQSLLAPGRHGDSIDPHVATLRDLLRHPGTFEHYARLLLTGNLSPTLLSEELTWSKLIGLRFDDDLRQTAIKCGKTKEEISRWLTRLAVTAWEQKSLDFKLDIETLRTTIPELRIENLEPVASPFASLLDNGVLRQYDSPSATRLVGFDVSDAGAYFLSFDLEKRLRDIQSKEDELRNMIKAWVEQSWNYSPILDAILALIDRLVDAQDNHKLKLILRIILEKRHIVGRGIFHLISPNAISTLFEILKEDGKDDFHRYRDAAVEIRPSISMLEIVRQHLSSEKPLIRQLAAKIVGIYKDKQSISDLIDMLDDHDEHVRREVYKAVGRIGRDAIDGLLDSLDAASDDSDASELRSRYLIALRNIGFRAEGVSKLLGKCLEDGFNGNEELLRSALVTTLHLRDTKQTDFALRAVRNSNHMIALTAANILAQFPLPSAFEEISDSLRPQLSPDGKLIDRYTIPLLLMRALIGADRNKAEPIVLRQILDGLRGSGELSPSESVQVAIDLGIQDAFLNILENLINRLRESSQRGETEAIIEQLAEVWAPDQLKAMAEAAHLLESSDNNIAQVFADALIPGMELEGEFPLADKLNLSSEYYPVVKCQAADLVSETSRLLQHATEFNACDLCNLLWITADKRAEAGLLKKLEETNSDDDTARMVRDDVIRALGTCGTKQGAEEVLNYLQTEQRYRISISHETLWPLAKNNYLPTSRLVEIAENPEQPSYVRTTCLEVLSILGAEHFETTFLKLSSDDANDSLQATAVGGLDRIQGQRTTRQLLRLIRAGKHTVVKAQAAEILSLINETRAIPYIERALSSSPGIYAGDFAEALAKFQNPASISALVSALRQAPEELRSTYIEAICSFWRFREGRQAVLEQFERWGERRLSFFNEQSPLIRGMIKQDANFLLEQVKKHYDDGYLTPGALETLAINIPHLYNANNLDEQLFLDVLERVLCDPHIPSREYAAGALIYIDPSFCRRLYEFLWGSKESDERRRACAVYTLGFWDVHEELIESARFAEEWLVRRAADMALERRRERAYLHTHIKEFISSNNLARLSAYLAIRAHGDRNTVRSLYSAIPEDNVLRAFLEHLGSHIKERLRKDYQEIERKEKEAMNNRGSVSLS